jgi:hypothetical protein
MRLGVPVASPITVNGVVCCCLAGVRRSRLAAHVGCPPVDLRHHSTSLLPTLILRLQAVRIFQSSHLFANSLLRNDLSGLRTLEGSARAKPLIVMVPYFSSV